MATEADNTVASLIESVDRLELKPGDILVVRYPPSGPAGKEHLEGIVTGLLKGRENVTAVLLPEGFDAKAYSREQLLRMLGLD